MALDHALAATLEPGAGVVRFYSWTAPTVSFGRNEPAHGRYDLDAARRQGIHFVRRPTGGRAVLHAHEITYSVIAPIRSLGGARAAYRRINEGLVQGLAQLGVAAWLSEGGPPLAPDAGPCFGAPAPGEVVTGGSKLIGSAQARVGDHLLQHGSVILSGDQSALARLAGAVPDGMRPATLEDHLTRADRDGVIEALAGGILLALGGSWSKGGYSPTETGVAQRLERERYAQDAWTWRR